MDVIGIFAGSLLIIVVASMLFTNAIEWAGYGLHLGSGATGSLLAAFGTSLPETIVPIVALFTAAADAQQVAVGAVLGSSFLLLTVGALVMGGALLLTQRPSTLRVDAAQARRDLCAFLVAFSLAFLASNILQGVRIAVGIVLLVTYASYVGLTLRSSVPHNEMPEPLHFVRWRQGPPAVLVVVLQLLVAIVMLIGGSKLFVDDLITASHHVNVNPLALAVILVPLATELPETLNSVLWIRTRDDGLAFGNIAGSAAFQACILGWLGVTWTPWSLGRSGAISALCTLLAAAYLTLLIRNGRARAWTLSLAAIPWFAYAIVMFAVAH